MTGTFLKPLKTTFQAALVALALLPLSASAVLMNGDITFEFDFLSTGFGGTIIDQGGGTITFPDLGPSSPSSPFPGVDLDLTMTSTSYTEADLQSIAWTITPDMTMLTSLSLALDSDPTCVAGMNCSHDTATVNISDNVGSWRAIRSICYTEYCLSLEYGGPRTATAAAVPEPATLALLSLGLAGLGFTRRRMKA